MINNFGDNKPIIVNICIKTSLTVTEKTYMRYIILQYITLHVRLDVL